MAAAYTYVDVGDYSEVGPVQGKLDEMTAAGWKLVSTDVTLLFYGHHFIRYSMWWQADASVRS